MKTMTFQQEQKAAVKLHNLSTGPKSLKTYEKFRKELIDNYGYNQYREIQRLAFLKSDWS